MAKGKPVQEVVLRPLSDLKPNPKNPRRSDPEGLENLKESIRNNPKYFAARPILLSDRTGELIIIAGERRSEAAAELGMTEVPTILLSGLTEEQEDEIMVRDNVHAGKWEDKKLNELTKKWGKDVVKDWAAGVSWITDSNIDISSLFKEEKHEKEKSDKWFEIIIVCSPDIDQQTVKERLAEFLQEFAGSVKLK